MHDFFRNVEDAQFGPIGVCPPPFSCVFCGESVVREPGGEVARGSPHVQEAGGGPGEEKDINNTPPGAGRFVHGSNGCQLKCGDVGFTTSAFIPLL